MTASDYILFIDLVLAVCSKHELNRYIRIKEQQACQLTTVALKPRVIYLCTF